MSEVSHKEYSNGEITVIWKSELCIHSAICVKNSPEVFRPKERPWVKIDAESSEKIKHTVEKCPSGALSYRVENNVESQTSSNAQTPITSVEILKDGPLIVSGKIEIKTGDGTVNSSPAMTNAFCRCGASKSKPFCDGSHLEINFTG